MPPRCLSRGYAIPAQASFINDIIHCRLLFLFADVVCLFADDFGNADTLVSRLKTWLHVGSASMLPVSTRPSLLIVSSHKQDSTAPTIRESFSGSQVAQSFSSIHDVHVEQTDLSPMSQFLRLKDTILRHANDSFQSRRSKYAAFSAVHLSSLFSDAVGQCGLSASRLFNPLTAMRPSQDTHDLTIHLNRAFEICHKRRVPHNEVVAFIASALLMDAYPPKMHGQ